MKQNKQKQNTLIQRQNKLLLAFEQGKISDEQLSQKLAMLNSRQNNIPLKPMIPESITALIDLNVMIDRNPTVAQYTLYQGIIDRIEINPEKKVTAIYLKGFDQNIMEVNNNVS